MTDKILSVSFVTGIIGFAILFYVRWIKSDKFTRLTAVGAILFVQVFIVFFSVMIIESRQLKFARYRIRTFSKKEGLTIIFNDQKLDSSSAKKILDVLQMFDKFPYHHSHPEEVNKVQLISPIDTLNLLFKKDSEIEDEYWIFWPNFSNEAEIGLVKLTLNPDNGS
jgi:hypothetical protein